VPVRAHTIRQYVYGVFGQMDDGGVVDGHVMRDFRDAVISSATVRTPWSLSLKSSEA
jgi:hypothetical protein